MARNDAAAQTAANSANTISSTAAENAGGLYGVLAPELESEAAHPQGFDPTTMAQMTTAAEQAAGGSQAGATGQGGLLAASSLATEGIGGDEAVCKVADCPECTIPKKVIDILAPIFSAPDFPLSEEGYAKFMQDVQATGFFKKNKKSTEGDFEE